MTNKRKRERNKQQQTDKQNKGDENYLQAKTNV